MVSDKEEYNGFKCQIINLTFKLFFLIRYDFINVNLKKENQKTNKKNESESTEAIQSLQICE